LMAFVFMILFFVSCTKRPVTPTRDSRRAIDTIFQKELLTIQPELDSMCKLLQDSLYPLAIDSILNERQMEMNNLVE
jgi:hypothetical protein